VIIGPSETTVRSGILSHGRMTTAGPFDVRSCERGTGGRRAPQRLIGVCGERDGFDQA
jgi:hypothetical protein